MKKILKSFSFITIIFTSLVMNSGCSKSPKNIIHSSPNETVSVSFFLNGESQPAYQIYYNGDLVIDTSKMGFEFRDQPSLGKKLKIVDYSESYYEDEWETVWGEQKRIINDFGQLRVDLEEEIHPNRKFTLIFKIYDDGVGFRYEFPVQENMDDVVIMAENTEFNLTGNHKCWWIPGDWDIYEHLYNTTKLSEIDALSKRGNEALAQTYIPFNAVNTPVTMKTEDGVYLSFHEANLTDYAGMTLKVDTKNLSFTSELVGAGDGSKVKTKTPFVTPWRTVQLAGKAGDLIESNLIVNLNEPNKLEDVSWIEPMKYVGIWWEMHIGKSSWDFQSGIHGATTENAKRYIDFASANSIDAVLVEGWNTGWERWIGFEDREGVFDFVTPYPDYDIEEVVRYAKSKGIEIIMHHETSAAPRTYEQQLDTAFTLMNKLGIRAVKTGYVGQIIPKGEYHHGQWMVNHYRKVLTTAADYKIMVNAHEPIKATGIRRTYPNMISREGLRGQEFNAWSPDGGNPPEHLTIVPFTRMLAGPIDFTPGIFNIKLDNYKKENQINTTLAHQLALYVVIYSPIQMAADLPEHYEGHPAFQFIRDVPVDWQYSKVLDGEIGDFVVIARKDRNSGNWFLGAVTDENERSFDIALDFLDKGKTYKSVIYRDSEDAHWNDNPTAYTIEQKEVSSEDEIELWLAEGGGVAISFFEKK